MFNSGNDGESQVKSAELIFRDAVARNDRMPLSPLAIALGDFNGSQNDRAWQLFTGTLTYNGVTGDFTDSWWQTHGTWLNAGTFHGFSGGTISGNSRIDWILHRGGFTATQCDIVTDLAVATGCPTCPRNQYASDHYPVFAVLQLPAPRADYDRDGVPDTVELATPGFNPTNPDSDGDGVTDGEELVDPRDIREHPMDGLRDHRATLLASNGLELWWRFDGRYLSVATQDAGEGNDNFIFVTRTPNVATNAPWAKAGSVAQWDAMLADENDNDFSAWYDAARAQITDLQKARGATFFAGLSGSHNGGWLEGVVDLAQLYGPGFTNAFYLAAAPYANADGDALIPSSQVPVGNGDGNVLGVSEYVKIEPGDLDGDGINDSADLDKDGDGLPDVWESAHSLNPGSAAGSNGTTGDPDGDGMTNLQEFFAGTDPQDAASAWRVSKIALAGGNIQLSWLAPYGRTCTVWRADANSFSNNLPWTCIYTNGGNTTFPVTTKNLVVPQNSDALGTFFKLRLQ